MGVCNFVSTPYVRKLERLKVTGSDLVKDLWASCFTFQHMFGSMYIYFISDIDHHSCKYILPFTGYMYRSGSVGPEREKNEGEE